MQNQSGAIQPLKIAVAGSSGFIGKSLCEALRNEGHEVASIVRTKPDKPSNAIYWNPEIKVIDYQSLETFDVVINLAGTPTSGRHWSDQRKIEFKEARIGSTRLLAHAITRLKKPPKIFLSASGIGYYGDRAAETLTESTKPGSGFFSQVCREWELATWEAQAIGMRVNHLRFGIVLSPDGGALKELLPLFRLGLGAILGDGSQYFPWVTKADAVRAILFLIHNQQPSGPFNIVAPQPVTNREFTYALAKVLRRPSFLKLSPHMVKLAVGEMGASLVLSSTRAVPEKLTNAGFRFDYPYLEAALKMLLGKRP